MELPLKNQTVALAATSQSKKAHKATMHSVPRNNTFIPCYNSYVTAVGVRELPLLKLLPVEAVQLSRLNY